MPQSEVEHSRDGGRELSDVATARRHVADRALRPGQVGTVGLEPEGHLIDRRDPARRMPWDEICRLRGLVPPARSVDAILREGHPDWASATNTGLHQPELRRLATACATVAVQHCPIDLRNEAEAYAELVSAGRSPGQLLLDEAGSDGRRLLEEALDA